MGVTDFPTDADEFIELLLYPAFNAAIDVVNGVDPAPGSVGDAAVALDVRLADGSEWQVTVAKRP